MIGITSFGAYIPRPRLERMTIFQNMGWYIPAIVMVAQGQRSFCNWDEDPITMAVAASRNCLKGLDKNKLDGLFLCSTSLPFADRLNAGIVQGALNLSEEISSQDVCSSLRSGTTGLMNALELVRSRGRDNILVVGSDQRIAKAASFYEMWFGDGAAAVTVGREGVLAEYLGGHSISADFIDHYRGSKNRFDYTWEERWVRDMGFSKLIPQAVDGLFKKLDMGMDQVDKLVFPCFFKAEHRKIARKLGADPEKVIDNMHEACGDTGSAHPLLMLAAVLEDAKPGERILVCGFGQGCDALYFQATEAIVDHNPACGLSPSLENKKVDDSYLRFLKFRGLIETETGIRAEAPTQTATSVLWRNRKMLAGLVGGKCEQCGTPQFPRMDICVNPECHAHGSQVDYEFSDRPAAVKTFTGDMLAVSVDPPAIYGMVQFEGGGRMLADFTDCELDEVFVGQPVDMSYRKRYTDEERGFTGYFWKAVPKPGSEAQASTADSLRFDGRVAIVTGAGGGLGKAYALELARRGAKLLVNDLGGARDGKGDSSSPADAVVAEIKAAGGEAIANYDSVSTAEGGAAIVKAAHSAWGRVDVVINNAGILRDKTLAKMEVADWKSVLDVHLRGAFHVTQPAFGLMREQGFGRIVMTTSAAGLYGNFGQTNYSAAKLGLVGLMNTLKLEGEKYDIRCNTVAPLALTRLTEDLLPPDMAERLEPEFVVPLVTWLSSEACQQTGQVFNAGAGYFNRAAVVASPGLVLGDGKTPPSVEQIHQAFDEICDLEGSREFADATASLTPMIQAFSGETSDAETSSADGGGGVAQIFAKMPEAFQADRASGIDVVFQYLIEGEGGGAWHAIIKDQTCRVQEGKHASPTTTIKMDAADFMQMMSGKLNAMVAYTSGKLKIEGDLMKSQLIEKIFKF